MSLAQLFYAKNQDKQYSRVQRPYQRRHKTFPRRRPVLFEPLEPRLLLSADPTILGLVVDPSLSTALVVSPPIVGSASPAALDPAVNLPTTLRGTPGSTVTAPVTIDNAAGLESVDLQIAYDSAKLDLLAVRTGTVTGGATLLTNPTDPTTATGALTVGLALTTPRGPGGGSLLEMDFRIKPTAAGGQTSLDLKSVSLNEGGLVVTPTPVAGLDQTDGVITILSNNSPPVAANDAFTVAEDHVLNVAAPGVLANDTDADANPLTALLVSNPAPGSLAFNANGSFTYTPGPNFNGSDSFTYKANDGQADSNVATVSLTITPVNDAPVGTAKTVTTLEDTPYTFGTADFGFTDPNDTPANTFLAVKVSTLPGAGSLAVTGGASLQAGDLVSAADIAAGKLQFTPAPNANGLAYAAFTFQVQDDGGTTNGGVDLDPTPKSLTVNVTPVNDAPVAVNDTFTTAEDTALSIPAPGVLANDTDVEGDPLTAVPVAGPTNGTLALSADGAFTFTPTANFTGLDSFTYKANDGLADSNVATVSLTVTPVNDAPQGTDTTVTTLEDTPHIFGTADFGFTDPNDSPANNLSAVKITTLPGAGSLTDNGAVVSTGQFVSATDITGGKLVFAPAANANGLAYAAFTFQVQDDGGTANGGVGLDPTPRTLTVNVTPVNDAPVAVNDAFTTNEDTVLTIPAPGLLTNDTDVEGDPLTAVLVDSPTHGTVGLSADGSFTYSPNANFNGADGFSYKANDGQADSNVATVSLTITPVNDAPAVQLTQEIDVTLDTSALADRNGEVAWDLIDGDGAIDNSVLITNFTTDGTLGPAAPTGGVNGTLPGGVTLSDDEFFNENLQAISFGNTIAFALHVTTEFAGGLPDSLSVVLLHNGTPMVTTDLPGDALLTIDLGGALSVAGATTPTVPIHLTGPVGPDQVVAEDAGPQTVQALAARITAGPADETNQTLAFQVSNDNPNLFAAPPVIGADGTLTYTPAPNAYGQARVMAVLKDDGGTVNGGVDTSAPQTFTLTVTSVNDAPQGTDTTITTLEDTPHTFAAADFGFSDPNDTPVNNLLAVKISTLPGAGSLTDNGIAVSAGQLVSVTDITGGKLVFAPAPNANGLAYAAFTFQVQDDGGTANGGVDLDPTPNTLTVNVTPVNDAPVAQNDAYTTAEDTSLTIAAPGVLGNDTDLDNATLTALLVAGPTNGTLALSADGSFTYSPNANFNGADGFSYKANDGQVDSNVATVALTITPVNDAPVAVNDAFTTNEDTVLTIPAPGLLTNDTDVEGDPLTAVLVDSPTHGTVGLSADGSFTYSPNANFNGADGFSYKANDGQADSNVATVALTITPTNHAPVAVNDAYTIAEDTTLIVPAGTGLLTNDVDVDGDLLTAVLVDSPTHGTVGLSADGSFTYSPNANFNGADGFSYKANDGQADSNVATVALTITPTNHAPVAVNDAYTIAEDTTLIVPAGTGLLTNDVDVDGDLLTAVLVDSPTHGTVGLSADGSFTYTPNGNVNGADGFSYKANDGQADSNVATVALTITPVNDAPVGTDTTVTTLEDTPHTFAAADFGFSDPNDTPVNNLLAVKITTLPGAGSLTDSGIAVSAGQLVSVTDITGGKLVFAPAPNANGLAYAAFTFQVQDDGGTATGGVDLDPTPRTLTVNVTPVNDAPVAVNDAYTVDKNAVLVVPANGVLANDTDIEGDALTAVLVANPVHGTLSLDGNGSLTYTPALNFSGADSFTYKANDGTADGNVARVDLTVTAPIINVDSRVRVTYSGFVLNRITDTFDTLATITNTSTGSLLLAPMSLVITGITPSSVTLDNATGETPDGRPFIAVQVPDGGLAPGASLSKILLKFSNPDLVRFKFTSSVLAVDPPVGLTAGVRPAVAVDNGRPAIEGDAISPRVEVITTPMIDWSRRFKESLEGEARSGSTGKVGAQPPWARAFVLDLAAAEDTWDCNGDISISIPVALDHHPGNGQRERVGGVG